MRRLQREVVKSFQAQPFNLDATLPQLMGSGPWAVAVAGIVCNRTNIRTASVAVQRLFMSIKTPEAAVEVSYSTLRNLLPRIEQNRAQLIQAFSRQWLQDNWHDMRQLPGVGLYVADCVGLFCYNCTELDSGNSGLWEYVEHGIIPHCVAL